MWLHFKKWKTLSAISLWWKYDGEGSDKNDYMRSLGLWDRPFEVAPQQYGCDTPYPCSGHCRGQRGSLAFLLKEETEAQRGDGPPRHCWEMVWSGPVLDSSSSDVPQGIHIPSEHPRQKAQSPALECLVLEVFCFFFLVGGTVC